jgi:hypothetical protein
MSAPRKELITRVLAHTIQLSRLASYRDGDKLLEHSIAAMVDLTRCDNAVVRMQAAQWLNSYAHSLLAKGVKHRDADAQIVAELRMLYAKALPADPAPSGEILEVAAEPEREPIK